MILSRSALMPFIRHLIFPSHAPARDGRCLVIGEVAQSHDGSVGMAHAFIDAIANSGADAVKFQTHIASAESTPSEPWRVKFSPQDDTRYDYWKRMEFTEQQWFALKSHTEQRGLLFLSSPFSTEAVDLLKRVGVAAWKVASGEVNNMVLFDHMVETRLPFLLSSGLSPWSEVDFAVEKVKTANLPFCVLQCTTAYPCPPEKVGLNLLAELKERYNCSVGLSDHSGTIYPSLAAVVLGAEAIEVHVTLSREMFGPDVSASITTSELRQLVEGIRFLEVVLSHPVDKDQLAGDMLLLRQLFTKSIVARLDLPAGTVLSLEHLAFKKPGTGIPPGRFGDVVGRRLARAIKADALLAESDLVAANGPPESSPRLLAKQTAKRTTTKQVSAPQASNH